MGFLDGLKSMFAGGSMADGGYYIYVRCSRCGEAIRTRVNLSNDPSEQEGVASPSARRWWAAADAVSSALK